MSSHFVEHKDLGDLLAQFSLPFGSQNVLVFIWKSVAGLKRNTIFDGDYVGAYVPNPYRKKSAGVFGEVHLVQAWISHEYVSHELQHFIYDWSTTQKTNADLEERQATLAGQIAGAFWTAYEKEKGTKSNG